MTENTSNVLLSEIYTSRNIILNIMGEQGYNTHDYLNIGRSELSTMIANNQLDILLEKKIADSEYNKKVYIHYFLGKTLRSGNIQDMIDDLFNLEEVLRKKHDTLFIIIKDEINEPLLKELRQIWDRDNILVVVESLKRLQFNILNHSLVPKHEIMNEEQVKEMLDRYNIININNLPEISRFDPVAKLLCMRPGDICHIVRPSKTAINADYYRLCV